MTKKALLVPSFGSSYSDTAKQNIEPLETILQLTFPDHRFYKAYTSNIIRAKIKKRDGVEILSVEEALQAIVADGMTELLVQPSHIIQGHEYNDILDMITKYKDHFDQVKMGSALLTESSDHSEIIDALKSKDFNQVDQQQALIYMGHGTNHAADQSYHNLDKAIKQAGFDHVYIATVEGADSLENIIPRLKKKKYRQIILLPFMLVAGDHAINDMASDDKDSWKSILEAEGFSVEAKLRGLGQVAEIRQIFVDRAQAALKI